MNSTHRPAAMLAAEVNRLVRGPAFADAFAELTRAMFTAEVAADDAGSRWNLKGTAEQLGDTLDRIRLNLLDAADLADQIGRYLAEPKQMIIPAPDSPDFYDPFGSPEDMLY